MQLKRKLRSFMKRTFIMPVVRKLRSWLSELNYDKEIPPEVEFDNTYPWLQYEFCKIVRDPICGQKRMYTWGVIQGAALAKILHIPRISFIEFGVAMGAGLKILERIAEMVEVDTKVSIDVFGFDSGTGLPKPRDYRDQPNMWLEGQLPMNRSALERELQRASLIIGLVKDTVQDFLARHPAPVAFVAFDLDLYSSTKDALELFSADYDYLLPRIACYFDDIFGHTYNDYTGQRLAISEFNSAHDTRKLDPMYGLRFYVPSPYQADMCWDCMYFAHFFNHPLYNTPDSIRKTVYADGRVGIGCPVDSNWRNVDLFQLAQTNDTGGYLYPTSEEIANMSRSKK